jgi:hypothetical protein
MNTSDWRFKKFAIQDSQKRTNEGIAVSTTCSLNNLPKRFIEDPTQVLSDEIPVGSVEFVEKAIGMSFEPDFYPDFAEMIINRMIWRSYEFPPKCKCFIKPLGQYKRFDAFVYDGKSTLEQKPPYWCSYIVNFVNEWRYYIQDGKIVFANWYKGVDEEAEPLAPQLPFKIPKGTFGALDIGILDTGKMEIVEFQHPYACGWYGKQLIQNNEIYTEWLAKGYEHLVGLKEHVQNML